ncbi:hypothetical protein MKQ70_06400 [Chitinophaga sedimenti]|uniref:hypothetical protein n=1 Tax=Chitinophaga sedimenti TaxID=2033606 RepID=UPI002005F97F|nr:hypothetical protein [Chitinophaga sedimenti]MCK7554653.1 hypothetical protein [Chitinophaga sedimenti]
MEPILDPKALIPYWAASFSQRDYMRFLTVIDNYCRKRELLYTLNNRELKIRGEPTRFAMLALEDLARRCAAAGEGEWPDLVRERLEALHHSAIFEQEFAEKADRYNYAKGFLAVRLYAPSYIAHFDKDQLLGQQVADDLYAMLVFDLGAVLKNVDPSRLVKWKVTTGVALQDALENMRVRQNAARVLLSGSLNGKVPVDQLGKWG